MKSARHEARMLIGEDEYTVLYTMQALADAETRTGKSITSLAQGAAASNLAVGDLANMFLSGLEAARRARLYSGRPFNLQRVYEMMEQAGYASVATVVFEGVGNVLGYDPDEEDADDSADPPAM